ncbi:DUF2513 domain-containing protein [Vibrio cholerae]|nr:MULTISPECIES: DUF2513 domain-containing protein [Gammaproteobacteria]NOE84029.1 DUF2513 domain-containing protein [Vibrio cholerae]NOE94325.1 DUF2513 domain-containing protein [Vibrio cholerae]NOF00907.1 DUF2513 domain-containing protein [Vibrio cholerae]NOF13239.1 DUF2513 domain-containing protein [Vibrio cholerae]NOF16670.1 DUF2513 domain-containing protein [Vibrio cholerae]
MRIDIEYIKYFLDAVLEHDKPDFRIDIEKLKPLWLNDDEKLNKLVFHMEILEDQRLIESSINTSGIGFRRMGDGGFTVSIIPLRLTAQGHQFASDLSKPGVVEKLATTFKDAGPTETVKVVFALGKNFIDRQLKDLIDE